MFVIIGRGAVRFLELALILLFLAVRVLLEPPVGVYAESFPLSHQLLEVVYVHTVQDGLHNHVPCCGRYVVILLQYDLARH